MCKKRIMEMFENDQKYLHYIIDQSMSCGALDLESFNDTYELPKIILTFAYERLMDARMPTPYKSRKEIKNLNNFL
jgi:hypothetical protein